MASSGTYTFAPDIADLVEHAYRLCGVDVATLTDRHSQDARFTLNLLFSMWATKGDLLFAVDQQTQIVTESEPTYSAALGTLSILEITVTRDGIDTPVYRIDRDQYQAIPNKTNEGLPTQLFYNRIANEFKLWNTPENSTDVITYWRLRRVQDVLSGQETPDVPFEWVIALVYGLAALLADIYAPEKADGLAVRAGALFVSADEFNRERHSTAFEVTYL